MPQQITHHAAYNTLERDDFGSMISLARYAERSDDFDDIGEHGGSRITRAARQHRAGWIARSPPR